MRKLIIKVEIKFYYQALRTITSIVRPSIHYQFFVD